MHTGAGTSARPADDPLPSAVLDGFNTVLRRQHRLMSRVLARHDLHPGQAMCLRRVIELDGVPQRRLADEMHLAPPTLTRILQRMERDGLVARAPDPEDRRTLLVRATDRGVELSRHVGDAIDASSRATLGRLSEDDLGHLARILPEWGRLVAEALDTLPEDPGSERQECE